MVRLGPSLPEAEIAGVPWVNIAAHSALGNGAGTANATANNAAFAAAIARAKGLGATGYLGATVVVPPGVYDISTPIVLPRTGTSPTNAVRLVGSGGPRPTVIRGTGAFPTNRALVEWEDTASRAWHQGIANITLNLPFVAGVRAIHYKLSGTVTTAAQVQAQWVQCDLENVVIEGQGDYSSNAAIKFEGGIRFSHWRNVFGDPSQGTYDVPLFEFDAQINGVDPLVGSDSVGFSFGLIENVVTTIRRGGYSTFLKGRLYFAIVRSVNANGGKSGNDSYVTHVINGYRFVVEQLTNEGQGEAAQVRLENCRWGLFRNSGLGTPDATDAAWQAGHVYVVGDRVVPTTLKQAATAARNAYYACTTAGTSHASVEPTWPASGTVADGTVVWTYQGAAVGGGLQLVGSTDCRWEGRHALGGAAAFSQRLVKAATLDAGSSRNVFADFHVNEATAGTASVEFTNAGTLNQVSGQGVTGSLGSETFTPYAVGAHHQHPVFLTGSKTHDWASVADGAQATTTVTVTGAALGDFAAATMDVSLVGTMLTAYVSATDTATVVLQNESGGAVDLASGTLRVAVRKAA